jgi:hypothetical protein
MKPEEVAPEWRRWRELLGSPAQLRRFVERAMSRLNAAVELEKGDTVRAHLAALPPAVSERLASRGLEGTVRLAFEEPPPTGTEMVGRCHPVPATLAESLLESVLDPASSPVPSLGRAGAWPTTAVKAVTTVALLRLRYKLTMHGRRERLLLAEEAGALAFEGFGGKPLLAGVDALALLELGATGDLAGVARQRMVNQAREHIAAALQATIAAYARERAEALAEDHARVRAAAAGIARVTVEPIVPADIIGLYVLVPAQH